MSDVTGRVCTKCGEWKPLGEFSWHKQNNGPMPRCKVCRRADAKAYQSTAAGRKAARERNRRWRESNPERARKIQRDHYARHRDRRIASAAKWTDKNRAKVNAYVRLREAKVLASALLVTDKDLRRIYNSPCFICGATERITMDHAIPVSRDGRHAIGNLIPLCKSCNSSKRDKTLMEFRIWKMRTSKSGDADGGCRNPYAFGRKVGQ